MKRRVSRKGRTGISTLVANVLLIALILSIAAILVAWAQINYGVFSLGNQIYYQQKRQASEERFFIEQVVFDANSRLVEVFVRNVGGEQIQVVAIYVNGTILTPFSVSGSCSQSGSPPAWLVPANNTVCGFSMRWSTIWYQDGTVFNIVVASARGNQVYWIGSALGAPVTVGITNTVTSVSQTIINTNSTVCTSGTMSNYTTTVCSPVTSSSTSTGTSYTTIVSTTTYPVSTQTFSRTTSTTTSYITTYAYTTLTSYRTTVYYTTTTSRTTYTTSSARTSTSTYTTTIVSTSYQTSTVTSDPIVVFFYQLIIPQKTFTTTETSTTSLNTNTTSTQTTTTTTPTKFTTTYTTTIPSTLTLTSTTKSMTSSWVTFPTTSTSIIKIPTLTSTTWTTFRTSYRTSSTVIRYTISSTTRTTTVMTTKATSTTSASTSTATFTDTTSQCSTIVTIPTEGGAMMLGPPITAEAQDWIGLLAGFSIMSMVFATSRKSRRIAVVREGIGKRDRSENVKGMKRNKDVKL